MCVLITGEGERIRKCKGRVFALKEEPHIERVWLPYDDSPGLAMSRAFGDFVLKNNGIICIPDVSHHRITRGDEFLVVASDGVSQLTSFTNRAFIDPGFIHLTFSLIEFCRCGM